MMIREPKRFSARHWWNLVTLFLAVAGLALWLMRFVDGRLVVAGLLVWGLLGMLLVPALMYEHLGFVDRWVFHDYAKAHTWYHKAIDTRKATSQGHCALASLAYAEGDLGEAAQLLEEASVHLTRDAHLHYLLSRVLSRQGRHEEALAEALRVVGMQANSVVGDVAVADALHAKGDVLSAASAYQKVVTERPDLVHGRLGLVKCYLLQGYRQAAKDQIERALTIAPKNPDVLYWAGKVANAENKRQDADRFLQAALDARPVSDQAYLVPYREVIASLCEARANLLQPMVATVEPPGRHLDSM